MTDKSPFEDTLNARAKTLTTSLSKPRPWLIWRLLFPGVRADDDPDRRKSMIRIHGDLIELGRLNEESRLTDGDRGRIERLIDPQPESLSLATAADLLQELDLILIERGDDIVVFPMVRDELSWTKGKTSWLTWDELFGRGSVAGLREFLDGERIADARLDAAKHHLITLKRARYDDQLVHRARQQLRADNLLVLGLILLVLIPVFVALAAATSGAPSLTTVLLVPVAGAFGAAMSGALKARDRMPRSGDIRNFRDGLLAQLLVGAGSAVVVLLALDSGVVKIAGVTADNWNARAVLGFVGGFSEAFFIGTVERISTLGAGTDTTGVGSPTGSPGT